MRVTTLWITKIMLIGVLTSSAIIIIAGVLNLIKSSNGNYNLIYQHASTQIESLSSPQTWILLGIWLLIITQIVRVTATVVFFKQRQEKILFWISIFVLLMLTFSIFVAPFFDFKHAI